jgi:hypothetical protein
MRCNGGMILTGESRIYSYIKLPKCHFVHHESHKDWPEYTVSLFTREKSFISLLYCDRLRPLRTRINACRWTASELGSVRRCESDPEADQLTLRTRWKPQGLL